MTAKTQSNLLLHLQQKVAGNSRAPFPLSPKHAGVITLLARNGKLVDFQSYSGGKELSTLHGRANLCGFSAAKRSS